MITCVLAIMLAVGVGADGAYSGLLLRDIVDGHTVVSWILPGPLGGEGLAAPSVDLARPDLIVSIDGHPMNASAFDALVAESAAGDVITIEYRRSRHRGGTIPGAMDHEDEVRVLELTLGDTNEWSGTVRMPCPRTLDVDFDSERLLDADDSEAVLGGALFDLGLNDAVDDLEQVFTEWAQRDDDHHMLPLVRAGFDDPWRLPEIAEAATAPLRAAALEPWRTVPAAAARLLDVRTPSVPGAVATLDDFVVRLDAADAALARALGDASVAAGGTQEMARRGLGLLAVPGRTFYIEGPTAHDDIAAIRVSLEIDFRRLIGAFALASSCATFDAAMLPGDATGPGVQLPAELADAVTGGVRVVLGDTESGWIIVGGDGPNSYDLSRLRAVIDPGGDDVYTASGWCLGNRVVIDVAGNDRYGGTVEHGAAAALLGVVLVDDRAGNDIYEGTTLACGAALYGAALLLDRDGADVYRGRTWSLGAACYGAGFIVDLGGDADAYEGDFLTEGVGGPRGVGALIDDGGRDLYRANGPTPSAYGTPAVHQAFSQGIGWGYRQYASGGIGAIVDLGGDDRYEAGEFAQGGAYYYALGVLYDAAGRDLYYGNRYGQGFGVHQAIGALIDDEGDDTYWSMTAASQGAAWDIGVGLLLDRAGNDSYQCDGLGQGGASQQAIAILLDLAGRDRYVARGGAIQGGAGSNTYHAETGALSLGVLIDLGGGDDLYSSGRGNDSTTKQGRVIEGDPGASPAWGVVVDR